MRIRDEGFSSKLESGQLFRGQPQFLDLISGFKIRGKGAGTAHYVKERYLLIGHSDDCFVKGVAVAEDIAMSRPVQPVE